MLGVAALLARLARGRGAPPLLWIVATAGLWAACGGQALLASALGTGAALGGGWLPLLAFGAAAGALLALALRAVPPALRGRARAAPVAPRPRAASPDAPALRPLARDRAPPHRAATPATAHSAAASRGERWHRPRSQA